MSRDTLTEAIEANKDLSDVQNQGSVAQFGDRMGLAVVEISVAALMAKLKVAALPIGDYTVRVPAGPADADGFQFTDFALPKGAVIGEIMVDTHEVKAGAGTITPKLGDTSLTAVDAVGVTDDTAKTGKVKLAADAVVTISVTVGTVTTGAFTIFVRYFQGN